MQITKIIKKLDKAGVKHKIEKDALVHRYTDQFCQWFLELQTGFNVLLFGFGSKKELLRSFGEKYLAEFPTVVAYGYSPNLTIKHVTLSATRTYDPSSC